MKTLFTQDNSRVLVMGVGALGCMAARLGAENRDDSAGTRWSAAHTNSAELIATGIEHKLFLNIAEGPFASRSAVRSVNENRALLQKLVVGRDAVILCGILDDARAMTLMEALGSALYEMNAPVYALILEPYYPGGETALKDLEPVRARLEARLPFLLLLHPGSETITAGISTKRLQKIAAERLANSAECLAAALDSANESAPQIRALKGRLTASFAALPGTGVSCSAFEAALKSVEDDERDRLAAVILQSADELTFREARAIARKLSEDIWNQAVLAASARASLAGRAECLLISGRKKPNNVIRIDALVKDDHNKMALAE